MPLFFYVFSLTLFHELVEDCRNFVDFLVCVTVLYGRKNTRMQVRVQHFLVDLGQNRLTRQYLIADVYAILFVLYHLIIPSICPPAVLSKRIIFASSLTIFSP